MDTTAALPVFKEILNRYPGSVPFTREYKDVFFGRDAEVEELYKYLNVNKLTVLYGKSGLGKSSLLNAGIIPKMERDDGFLALTVRFGSFIKDFPTTPKALFAARLDEAAGKNVFLADIEEDAMQFTLWRRYKALEWKISQASAPEDRSALKKGILLIFDQFEELFSYPTGVEEFAREFADVLNNKTPEGFQRKLYDRIKSDPNFLKNNEAQLDFIETPPATRVLIAIRSDRMSSLDRLSPYIPTILKNNYELKPLSREAAQGAIVEPAKIKGDFASLPFEYAPDVLNEVMSFLTEAGTKPAEPFQLQILCQYAEKIVEEKNIQIVSKGDLGVVEDIYKNHYDTIVGALPPDEQASARNLVEEGLIFQDGQMQRRLSIYEGQIKRDFGVSADLLKKLVDVHLLRSEPDSSGGFSYEICHDSMMAPILRARTARLAQEKIEEERQKRIEAEQKAVEAEKIRVEQELRLEESARQLAASEALKKQAEEQKLRAEEQKRQAEENERRVSESRRRLAIGVAVFLALALIASIFIFMYAYKKREQAYKRILDQQTQIAMLEKESKEAKEEAEVYNLKERGKVLQENGYCSAALELYGQAQAIIRVHELNDADLEPVKRELTDRIRACAGSAPDVPGRSTHTPGG